MPEMTQESNTWSLYSSPDYLLTTATCPVVNALQRYFILAGELLSMNAWAARRRHRRYFAERTPSVIFHAKSCRLIVRPEEKKRDVQECVDKSLRLTNERKVRLIQKSRPGRLVLARPSDVAGIRVKKWRNNRKMAHSTGIWIT
jgi:hypothetical protein